MTTTELKSLIVENVLNTNDTEFLKDIFKALKVRKKIPDTVRLKGFQKKKIERSIKQIEKGEYKTSEEVFKEIEGWLQKK